MFHSKSDGWTNALDGVVVAMELVEKSSDLHVGASNQLDVLSSPGDRVVMGTGNSFEFTPVVWTETNAAAGDRTLKFKLVDVSGGNNAMLDSGIVTFMYRVQGAPSLTIAQTVTLTMPIITEGYVLEEASSVDGPWTTVVETPVVETITGGHSAAQTGYKTLTQDGNAAMRFYRLRKL
jgi:hypothetical protein